MLTMNRLALLGTACLIASALSFCGGGGTNTPADMATPPDLTTIPDLVKPAPTITSIAPTTVTTMGGMITVTGTNFQTGATVTVGGTACANPTVTATSITCTVAAKAMGCGSAAVVVTNPDMQSVSNGTGLSYRTNAVTYATAVNTTMNSGNTPRRVIAVDLTGDGKPELVTANTGGSNVSIFTNTGTGTFTAAPLNLSTNLATGVGDVAIGDVNNDGKLDVVSANTTTGNITLYLATAANTYGAGTNVATIAAGSPSSIALADLNADMKLDVVVGNTSAGTFQVLLANTTGTNFTAVSTTVAGSNSIGDVELVDIDADGIRDLILTSRNQSNIVVYQGMANGTFGATPGTFTTGTNANPFGLVVADVNGDGKPDAVVANTALNQVAVLLNTGSRMFGAPAPFGTANAPETVAVADIDKDGVQDILTANGATGNFSYLRGTGNNTYAMVANRTTGTNANGFVVADFNGDGLQDVAVGHSTTNNAGVHIQQCQ